MEHFGKLIHQCKWYGCAKVGQW